MSINPIETQLDILESVGLVELYQTDPELEYLFRHVLIQEAAYASMVRYERRRLHHLVGEVIERRYDAGQRELAAVLALHFEQAGDQNRAVDYLVAAADYALERFANPFLDHKLSDIALHHDKKVPVRLVPTAAEYRAKLGKTPVRLQEAIDAS